MTDAPLDSHSSEYAASVADQSHKWYKRHAVLARRAYKLTEIAVIAISAAIPATVAIAPSNTKLIAILGAVVATIAGLRSVYHWQDDYVRFSQAREALEAERRLYRISGGKYKNQETRDEVLVATVSQIEQDDMRRWANITSHQDPVLP
jgi:hypothetical protein